MMVDLKKVIRYLKKNDAVLYEEYKDCISNPTVLINRLVRHYQWKFEISDYSWLNLQDRFNKNFLNLFLYGMECDKELANNFINYFINSFRAAFDFNNRKWNIDLIFNIFIHQFSRNEFDLIAMYVLMAATFNRFYLYVKNMVPDKKLAINTEEVVDFFNLVVDQTFYNDLKKEIAIKRKNSFYHKKPPFKINLPLTDKQIMQKKQLAILKKSQAEAEGFFHQQERMIREAESKQKLEALKLLEQQDNNTQIDSLKKMDKKYYLYDDNDFEFNDAE